MMIALSIAAAYFLVALLIFITVYRSWPLAKEAYSTYFIFLASVFWPATLILYYFDKK